MRSSISHVSNPSIARFRRCYPRKSLDPHLSSFAPIWLLAPFSGPAVLIHIHLMFHAEPAPTSQVPLPTSDFVLSHVLLHIDVVLSNSYLKSPDFWLQSPLQGPHFFSGLPGTTHLYLLSFFFLVKVSGLLALLQPLRLPSLSAFMSWIEFIVLILVGWAERKDKIPATA